MKKRLFKLLSLVMAAVILLSVALPTVSATSGNIDPDIIAETSKTAVELESEGIVLLKNEDNVLPLEGKKINIFGAGSVCPFLGGAGSGAITTDDPVTFYEALDADGIEYNTELRKLYEKNCGSNKMPKTDNTVINNLLQLVLAKNSLEEMATRKLTDSVMARAAEFSDTALIMISRTSAENKDLTADVLRLNKTEKELVEKVTSTFENVVVLFNTGNIMEMGWLNEYDSIKAAAMIWIPGEFGMTAVARMLCGKVNPSGKLADTVAYKVEDHPSTECFGSNRYKGGEYYVEYLEGIYVGYRYFETFAKDKVQYPFGYGLSYTSFDRQLIGSSTSGGKITAKVKITNTGKRSGKDVVQLYYSAPYYVGGLEKSAICLGGFAKTRLLAPGESETLTVSFDINDMASYDRADRQAWVLEKGEYKIYAASDIREHYGEFTYTLGKDKVIKTDSATRAEIKNLFDDVYGGYTILSRSDPEGTYPQFRALTASEAVKNSDKLPDPMTEGEAPKTGVKYDKTITLRDVYEDESLWDAFLDQLTLDEMTMLVIDGGYETYGVERLGIPHTMDNDGPSSVKGRNGLLYTDCGTAYPCETAIACTWNCPLAEKMGEGVGKEAEDMGTDIWYAPGVNIHRNPMAGRNFEYFSEDPVISGKMASAIISGCASQGLVTTIKHFVLNDQESNRAGIYTWADEQTMREIYLKAFEIPIKETKCCGIMSAFDRLGTVWCGASSALLNDLLRTEWGFEGFVVSDYSSNFTGTGYMNPVLAVYNGNDTILTGIWALNKPSHVAAIKLAYRRDPIGFGKALREACKNLCIAKMQTRAFLHPEKVYDDSLAASLQKPSDWNFEFPYAFSALRYVLNNTMNVVLWLLRYVL